MKFDATFRPWLAASTDETRGHLFNLKFEAEKKRLLATNGHILVSIPVVVEAGDKSGLLSKKSVKCAVERAEAECTDEAQIDCTSEARAVVGDVTFVRPNEVDPGVGKFPLADPVFPSFKGTKTHTFALDAAYLVRLANVLGQGTGNQDGVAAVKLTVKAEDGMIEVIRVEALHGDSVPGAVGLLMPCKL